MKKLHLKNSAMFSTSAMLLGRLLAVLALLLTLSVIPASANSSGCSDATLKGDYAYAVGGTTTIPPAGSVAILGKITLDGKGNFTGSATGSIAGLILTNMPLTGTYSIASDCTGTLTTIYPAFTAHFNFVLVEGVEGRWEAELIETDADTVATGTIKPVCRERI
jgi:hypothetical protein